MGWFNRTKKKFFAAVESGDTDTVKQMLESGAVDVNLPGKRGETALYKAIVKAQEEVVDLLLESGADVNLGNKDGASPLMRAASRNDGPLVERLIALGADVNAQDDIGSTTLLKVSAMNKPQTEVVRILIEHGADPNIRMNHGWSPLMFAAGNGHREIAAMLLAAGADTEIVSENDNTTAIMWASKAGHIEIVQQIKAHKNGEEIRADGWHRDDDSTITHITQMGGRELTEVFNFATQERSSFTRNMTTNAETAFREQFAAVSPDILKTAAEELKKQGGLDYTAPATKHKAPVKIGA